MLPVPDTVQSRWVPARLKIAPSLRIYSFPKGLTSIPHSIVQGLHKPFVRSSFPEAATNIEMYAFADCKSLTNLILPDGLVNITLAAFEGCTNLQRVVIPASVTGFPNDDTARSLRYVSRQSRKALVVYVEKGSSGERWAVNNVADWGYQYEILARCVQP